MSPGARRASAALPIWASGSLPWTLRGSPLLSLRVWDDPLNCPRTTNFYRVPHADNSLQRQRPPGRLPFPTRSGPPLPSLYVPFAPPLTLLSHLHPSFSWSILLPSPSETAGQLGSVHLALTRKSLTPPSPPSDALPSPHLLFLLALLALFAAFTPVSGFYILPQQPNATAQFVLSPLMVRISPPNVSFPLVSQMIYATQDNVPRNLLHKVLLLQTNSIAAKQNALDKLGAAPLKALVFIVSTPNPYPGMLGYSQLQITEPYLPFPVFEITQYQFQGFQSMLVNNSMMVSFNTSEPNPWVNVFTKFAPAFGILTMVGSGIVCVVAVYKLVVVISVVGVQLSVAQAVLFLNLVALLIRFVWCISDPFGAYRLTSEMWVQIGLTLPFSLTISSALLITLYWHEMIRRRNGPRINLFLNKMLIPFIVISVLLIAFELATDVLRALGLTPLIGVINGVFYFVIVFFLLCFFLVTNYRLRIVFNQINKTLNTSHEKRLKLGTRVLSWMVVAMLVWIIGLLIMASGQVIWIPAGFVAIWVLLFTFSIFLNFLQVLLIRVPYRPWKWLFLGLCIENPGSLIDESDTFRTTSFASQSRGKSASSKMEAFQSNQTTTSSDGPAELEV